MAVSNGSFGLVSLVALICATLFSLASAQSPAPAPSDSPLTSDGIFLFVFFRLKTIVDSLIYIYVPIRIWNWKFRIAGTSIDQGVAYFLMLVALVLTYLIHWAPTDFIRFSRQRCTNTNIWGQTKKFQLDCNFLYKFLFSNGYFILIFCSIFFCFLIFILQLRTAFILLVNFKGSMTQNNTRASLL